MSCGVSAGQTCNAACGPVTFTSNGAGGAVRECRNCMAIGRLIAAPIIINSSSSIRGRFIFAVVLLNYIRNANSEPQERKKIRKERERG